MLYVTYDANGELTGAFRQDLRPEHAACHIEVDEAELLNWVDYRANADRSGVELIGAGPAASPTLADLIARRRAESDALAATKRNAVVAGTSPAEMSSWPIKLDEAVKFAASSNPADAPYLGAEATARGVTLADLVARVQANGATLASLEAQIAGVNGKHRDALAAMTTSADVLAYDITTGYPA